VIVAISVIEVTGYWVYFQSVSWEKH